MIKNLLTLFLSVQIALAPAANALANTCESFDIIQQEKEELGIEPSKLKEGYKTFTTTIKGLYDYFSEPGAWKKYPDWQKLDALQSLKPFFLVEIMRSRVQIENTLYCLSQPMRSLKQNPRKILGVEFNEPMFDMITTCEDKLREIHSSVNSNFKEMRLHMALMKTSWELSKGMPEFELTSHWGPQSLNLNQMKHDSIERIMSIRRSKNIPEDLRAEWLKKAQADYDKIQNEIKIVISHYDWMSPNPVHTFDGLPQMPPLTFSEISEAVKSYTGELDSIKNRYLKSVCIKPGSEDEKNVAYTHKDSIDYIISRFVVWQKENYENYLNVMAKEPVIAFLPNYLGQNYSELDREVLKKGFMEISKLNCKAVVKSLVTPEIKSQHEIARRGKPIHMSYWSGVTKYENKYPDLETLLCEGDLTSSEKIKVLDALPHLAEIRAVVDKAYRYEHQLSETEVLQSRAMMMDIIKVNPEIAELTDTEINTLLDNLVPESANLNGKNHVSLDQLVDIAPAQGKNDEERYKSLLGYAEYLPVIERLTEFPNFSDHKDVLMALHAEHGSDQMKSDLFMGVAWGVGGPVICKYGLQALPIGKALGVAGKIIKLSKKSAGNFCAFSVELGLAMYFLHLESVQRYQDRYFRGFFATPDGKRALLSMNQLSGSQMAKTIEKFMFFLSIGISGHYLRQLTKTL